MPLQHSKLSVDHRLAKKESKNAVINSSLVVISALEADTTRYACHVSFPNV